MLKSPFFARLASDRLVPSHFVTRDAQAIFKACCAVLQLGQEVNRTALATKVQADTPASLSFLMDHVVPRTGDDDIRDDIADILITSLHEWAEDWRIRDAFHRANESLKEGEPAYYVRDTFLSNIDAITDLRDPEQVYDDLSKHAQEAMKFLLDRDDKGVTWGFSAMDRVLMPMLAGDLVEIGGAGGAGKSTLARNLVSGWIETGASGYAPIAWLTLEMSGPTQLLLLSAVKERLPISALLKKTASFEQLSQMDRCLAGIQRSGMLILNERSRMTPSRMLSTMERYHSDGARLFVVDHINRIDYGETRGVDLRLEMGAFVRDLKSFAQTNRSVVIALVQLVKMSPHEEPNDSNIRESAKIIEEADKILFVWKPLVQARERLDGGFDILHPRRFDAPTGRDAQGIRMVTDNERVYITPGKQRILPPQALIAVRYDPDTGAMFDERKEYDHS